MEEKIDQLLNIKELPIDIQDVIISRIKQQNDSLSENDLRHKGKIKI